MFVCARVYVMVVLFVFDCMHFFVTYWHKNTDYSETGSRPALMRQKMVLNALGLTGSQCNVVTKAAGQTRV